MYPTRYPTSQNRLEVRFPNEDSLFADSVDTGTINSERMGRNSYHFSTHREAARSLQSNELISTEFARPFVTTFANSTSPMPSPS